MTHTRFTVLDDTQRHPDLAQKIFRILRQVAPTVNETAGLPLPAKARFRLLTSKARRPEHAARADQQVTTRLLGTSADCRTAPKSPRYRIRTVLLGIRRPGLSPTRYDQDSRLTAQTGPEPGTSLINHVPPRRNSPTPRPGSISSTGDSRMPDLLLRPADLDDSDRMGRIHGVVLDLLFDLTQQAARFGSSPQPWASLATYDADEFAAFTTGGRA